MLGNRQPPDQVRIDVVAAQERPERLCLLFMVVIACALKRLLEAMREAPVGGTRVGEYADCIGDLLDLFLARGIERLSLVGGLSEAITPWLTPDLRARLKRPDADAAAGALLVARGRLALPKMETGAETEHEPVPKFRV